MLKYLARQLKRVKKTLTAWSRTHVLGLFVFNLTVLLMVLLNSAGYFRPFFFLTINRIFFIGLILGVILLGAREKALFAIAIIFFLFATFLKIVKVGVWADRSSIYVYQSLVLGIILLLINILLYTHKRKK